MSAIPANHVHELIVVTVGVSSVYLIVLFQYEQMKDLTILLEAHTTWLLKSFIDLIVWKQIFGALALSHIFCYAEAGHFGQGQNLEFFVLY